MKQTRIGKLQKVILQILEESAMATFALLTSSMNSRKVFRTLREYERNRQREQVFQAVLALKRRRLIDFKADGEKAIMRLTREGKEVVLRYQFDAMRLPKAAKWDKTWRLVLFDIPERRGAARRALSRKLKDVGALQLQRSVFIYPFECRDEVDFITEFFQVSPYVRYAKVSAMEGEDNLRAHFSL